MTDDERNWLENFKRVNGFNGTSAAVNSTQRRAPITSHRARKPHRLSAILDVNQLALRIHLRAAVAPPPAPKPVQLGRLDLLLGRSRRDPRSTK